MGADSERLTMSCVRFFPSPCAWSQEGAGAASGPATVWIPGCQTAPVNAHTCNDNSENWAESKMVLAVNN